MYFNPKLALIFGSVIGLLGIFMSTFLKGYLSFAILYSVYGGIGMGMTCFAEYKTLRHRLGSLDNHSSLFNYAGLATGGIMTNIIAYVYFNHENAQPEIKVKGGFVFESKDIKFDSFIIINLVIWLIMLLISIVLVSRGKPIYIQELRRVRIPRENTSEMETFLTSNQQIAYNNSSNEGTDLNRTQRQQEQFAYVRVNVREPPGLPLRDVITHHEFWLLVLTTISETNCAYTFLIYKSFGMTLFKNDLLFTLLGITCIILFLISYIFFKMICSKYGYKYIYIAIQSII